MSNDLYPQTLEEAVNLLIDLLTEEQREALKNAPKEELISYHLSLGILICNNFGLWDTNTALLGDCGYPLMHPDDASAVIIKKVWEKLNE